MFFEFFYVQKDDVTKNCDENVDAEKNPVLLLEQRIKNVRRSNPKYFCELSGITKPNNVYLYINSMIINFTKRTV